MSAHTAPPPQYFMPVPVSETPMSMTVMPDTMGGKAFLSWRGGMKLRTIARNAHTITVPSILP